MTVVVEAAEKFPPSSRRRPESSGFVLLVDISFRHGFNVRLTINFITYYVWIGH
jgi:hypothetical protein